MINYTLSKWDGTQWVNLPCELTLPFTLGFTLDESLDSGKIDLVSSSKLEITPFTLIQIEAEYIGEISTKTKEYRFFTGSISSTKKNMSDGELWDTSVELIELTKILERNYLQTITFTKPLEGVGIYESKYIPTSWLSQSEAAQFGHPWGFNEYKDIRIDAEGNSRGVDSNYYAYTEIEQGDTIYLSKLKDILTVDIKDPSKWLFAIIYYGYQLSYADGWEYPEVQTNGGAWERVTKITAGAVGTTYKIRYVGFITQDERSKVSPDRFAYYQTFTLTATIKVVEKATKVKDWDIASVIQRTLNIAQNQGWDENGELYPKSVIVLDNAIKERYSGVAAPDFSFTNTTLFEALLQIGKVINAIPRLVFKRGQFVLTYDSLGVGRSFDEPTPIGEDSSLLIEDYASDFVIPSQSVVNTLGDNGGTISDMTLRTVQGEILVDADTGIAMTDFPIYRIKNVRLSFPYSYGGVTKNFNKDITKFVVEKAIYDLLNPYVTSGTSAKSLRLYYTQNTKNIYGINYKGADINPDVAAFKIPAIVNIIRNLDGTYSDNPEAYDYTKFRFKIEYIPSFNGRVSQHRERPDIYGFKNEIIYNQATNVAETKSLSGNIYGAAKRMGNESLRRTYLLDSFDERDYIGNLFVENGKKMYVSDISAKYEKDHVTATFTYTQDFNRLNAYTSLDSQHRLYEIDEKQSVRRNVVIKKNIICAPKDITLKPLERKTHILTPITSAGFSIVLRYMLGTCYDKDNEEIIKFKVPTIRNAIGSSLWIHADFYDNFGIGYQSTNENVKPGEKKKTQRLVPYTDEKGRLYRMMMSFWWGKMGSGDLSPQDTEGFNTEFKFKEFDENLYIDKDSREALSFDYQVQYISRGWNDNVSILHSWMQKSDLYVEKEDEETYLILVKSYDIHVSPYTGEAGPEPISIDDTYLEISPNGSSKTILNIGTNPSAKDRVIFAQKIITNTLWDAEIPTEAAYFSSLTYNGIRPIAELPSATDTHYMFYDSNKKALKDSSGKYIIMSAWTTSPTEISYKLEDYTIVEGGDVNMILVKDPTITELQFGTEN